MNEPVSFLIIGVTMIGVLKCLACLNVSKWLKVKPFQNGRS